MTETKDGGPARLPTVDGTIAMVSAEDLPALTPFRWIVGRNGYVYKSGARKRGVQCLLHRIVVGAQAGTEVHHKNGNKLDCRRENLEETTASEHQRHHKNSLVARNKASRVHPSEGVCRYCGQSYTKHPDHRGRQTCCSKPCAMALAVKIRMERKDEAAR